MRRLSKREVHLIIALVAVAVLALVGIAFTPPTPPNPEEVHAYYLDLFDQAQEVTIRPANGGEPVRATRDLARGLFSDFGWSARNGGVIEMQSPESPSYLLELTLSDGTMVEGMRVGSYLEAPDQPARGKLWFYPGPPMGHARGEPMSKPPMVTTIDEYLQSLKEQPSESIDESSDQTTSEREAAGS
ncbi:MAG: hypothetical protein JXA57_00580 [Armatimonadetes bacterium]|nr:hypothetical protein [Armatimonadota bacterium]